MDISVDDLLGNYGAEMARMTQRAIVAETRADAAEKRLKELEGNAEKDEG